ncbi:MAG: hypothetical protein ACFE9Q_14220 [Candidatus Hodarchaeota archaeon]
MIETLNNLFNNIELSWIDSVIDIDKSDEFFNLLQIFPNLKKIFQNAQEINKEEFQRTIKHIFRSFKIFFLINNGTFSHETLSQESITKIREKVLKQHSKNSLLIPILLMYHDIGRYIDNKEHPYHSYQLITNKGLLKSFELSDVEKLLLRKLIQYHLLMATIYTGESTFYGIYSLLNDKEFLELRSHENATNKFVDLLEVFTYIDILGYVYTKIFDHYVKYYDEINNKLKRILSHLPDKKRALKIAKEYSQEWLEWRLAGALRIFQFVETKPYLTKEFYYEKLEDSLKQSDNQLIKDLNWDLLKDKYLIHSYKIQMRYSLALLMILAFGNFQRMGLKINTGISYKLILFWMILSKEITSRSENNPKAIWNVYFKGMPHWSKIDKSFISMLNDDIIESLIQSSEYEYNHQKEEYNLYIDLNTIIHKIF